MLTFSKRDEILGTNLNKMEIQRVLFSGGGVRGIAYAGCLRCLWKEHQIDWGQRCPPLKSVAGCSIGALFAFFICLGYSSSEIEAIAKSVKPDSFVSLDFSRIFPGNTISLDSGECVKTLLVQWLMKKCPEIESEAEALRYSIEKLQQKKKMELRIYVTHIDTKTLECVNEQNSVISALLASMALPPIYPSVMLYSPDKQPSVSHYADGGLVNYFPLKHEHPETLGFRLIQKQFGMHQVFKMPMPFLSYLTLAMDIAVSEKEVIQWEQLSKAQQSSTVTIVCGTEMGSMDLHLKDSESGVMFSAGEKAMQEYLTALAKE